MNLPAPHPAPGPTFATLVRALDGTLAREDSGLRAYEEAARAARSARLGDGVAYALEVVTEEVALSRAARDLIEALAPIEPQIRALLAQHAPILDLMRAEVAA